MHPNHVSRLEAGQMQPRPSTLEKLSRVFEVPTEELVAAGHDEPPPRLGQEDPELAQLLTQVGMLNEEQRLALRQVLRSMLTCQKLQHLASGQALSPL
jgi:transcriptional regulator with XRE-family HTH domain